MTTTARAPSDMTAAERLRELSDLFALAYVRHLTANRESGNALAESADPERPCVVHPVESPTTSGGKEMS